MPSAPNLGSQAVRLSQFAQSPDAAASRASFLRIQLESPSSGGIMPRSSSPASSGSLTPAAASVFLAGAFQKSQISRTETSVRLKTSRPVSANFCSVAA